MSEPRCDICERPYPHDIVPHPDEEEMTPHRWPPELFVDPVDAYLASHEADEELARALAAHLVAFVREPESFEAHDAVATSILAELRKVRAE